MLKDTDIKSLSAEVDDVLALIAQKYSISALSMSAVVNARLMHANREGGSEDDFRALLRTIAGKDYESSYTSYSRH